jgi:hypothetical protein
VSAGATTLQVTDGGTTLTLNLASATQIPAYHLVNDGGVEELVPCYAAGTHILTESGEVLVEDIAVGDRLVTVREGGPMTRQVVWIGRRRLDITRHAEPELVRPVRILAGAFAPGVPERDLRLSPHHAVYLDGVFFEAASLVNGRTIFVEAHTRFVTYHHVELDSHDVILAEGLPAESFVNTGNRNMFENTDEPIMLHPHFRANGEAGFCAPILREGERLEAARAKLLARALGEEDQKKASRRSLF